MKMAVYFEHKIAICLQVVIGAVFTCLYSCKNDIIFEEAYRPKVNEYRKNFEEKYGKIPVDQSWDFSTCDNPETDNFDIYECSLVDGLEFSYVGRNGVDIEGNNGIAYYRVLQALLDNKTISIGNAIIVSPSQSFVLYPFFTCSSRLFDLYAKVGDQEPILLFSKDWTDSTTTYYSNGQILEQKNGRIVEMKGLRINATYGMPIQLYFRYKDEPLKEKDMAFCHSILIDCEESPDIIDFSDTVQPLYFGLGSDETKTDIVLMAVSMSEEVLLSKVIEDGLFCQGSIGKRYMAENLGKTDGSDFNDVVIDVFRESYLRGSFENGVLQSTNFDHYEYSAYIRHFGDTLSWTLKIGDCIPFKGWQDCEIQDNLYQIPDSKGKIPLDFISEPWNPQENNITLYFNWNRDKSLVPDWGRNEAGEFKKGIYTVPFPSCGEPPLMIATDITEHWRTEGDVATMNWWNYIGFKTIDK